jgi:hypothetical protein
MEKASSSAFRSLWRASRSVFVNDVAAQAEAKRRIRHAFRNKAPATEKEKEKQLLVANDTARLLRDTVVQAVLKPEVNRYKAGFKPEHMTKEGESELL